MSLHQVCLTDRRAQGCDHQRGVVVERLSRSSDDDVELADPTISQALISGGGRQDGRRGECASAYRTRDRVHQLIPGWPIDGQRARGQGGGSPIQLDGKSKTVSLVLLDQDGASDAGLVDGCAHSTHAMVMVKMANRDQPPVCAAAPSAKQNTNAASF